jgi:hypothetical protein
MEVDAIDGLAVSFRLGRGKGCKNRERGVADWWRKYRFLKEVADGPPVARWLLTDRFNENPRAANHASTCRLRRDSDSPNAEPRNGVLDGREGRARVDERTEDHVPAGA